MSPLTQEGRIAGSQNPKGSTPNRSSSERPELGMIGRDPNNLWRLSVHRRPWVAGPCWHQARVGWVVGARL